MSSSTCGESRITGASGCDAVIDTGDHVDDDAVGDMWLMMMLLLLSKVVASDGRGCDCDCSCCHCGEDAAAGA